MYDIISSMGYKKPVSYKLNILKLLITISTISIIFIIFASIDNASEIAMEKLFISLAANFISLFFSIAVSTILAMGIYKLMDKITGCFSNENQNFIWQENYLMSMTPSVIVCISNFNGENLGYFVKGGLSVLAIYNIQKIREHFSNNIYKIKYR